MGPKEESDLRTILLEHKRQSEEANRLSAEWRKMMEGEFADVKSDLKKCLEDNARYQNFETGAKTLIWVGKGIIFLGAAIGGAYTFFFKH